MSVVDKIIVSNRQALAAKYGPAGVTAIDAALARLIAADLARGHVSRVIEIDDAGQMAAVGGVPTLGPTDQRGAKRAVDAIHAREKPDFLLLLDGPDVIPHIELNPIAGLRDADPLIDSDLPYACAAPFSTSAAAFLAVTRVVGRLPASRGAASHDAIVALIDRSISHAPLPAPQGARPFFAISADVWKLSTQLSLSALFGGHAGLHIAPKATHTAIDASLAATSHFINCHGAKADWRFYGENAGTYPIAMESAPTGLNVVDGTIVAAECCYGAELYDHTLGGHPQPICMSYLLNGAVAFMGATTIAYGPPSSNGQADLICQYFLDYAMAGASTGRAMLQARQRFVATQTMSGATNLKTLAQFLLYGDPSLVAVAAPPAQPHVMGFAAPVAAPEEALAKDRHNARKARRIALESDGEAFAAASTKPGRKTKTTEETARRLKEIAKANGFTTEPQVFAVSGGRDFRAAAKRFGRTQKVAVAVERAHTPAVTETGAELPSFRVLVAQIVSDGLTRVEVTESR